MSDLFQNDHSEPTTEVKFEDLVGEGKKYSDPEAVAKAIVEKDRFIEQLKRENAEAREAAVKQKNEQEFMDRLEQFAQRRSPEVAPQEAQRDEVAPAVTPEQIVAIIEARETQKVKQKNLDEVSNTLSALYGPDWKAKVQAKAKELGVGTQYLTDVAATSPKAVYAVLGINPDTPQQKVDVSPPRTAVTQSFTPANPNVKDYQYWQQQRLEKGENWYFTQSVQKQIWDAVKTLGEAKFYERSPN